MESETLACSLEQKRWAVLGSTSSTEKTHKLLEFGQFVSTISFFYEFRHTLQADLSGSFSDTLCYL